MKTANCAQPFDKEAELELPGSSVEWSVSQPARIHTVNDDEPTAEDFMSIVETSGVLEFWNDRGEDVYDDQDGEPA